MKIWKPHPKQELALSISPDDAFEVLFGGARGGGKGLPLDANILTPYGWRKNGDLKTGNKILNPDGSSQSVVAIYDHKRMDQYEVITADGVRIITDQNHLWKARRVTRNGSGGKIGWEIMTTPQMLDHIENGWNVSIPLTKPLRFTKSYKTNQRTIEPYILGCLIGDGGLTTSARISSADDFILDRFREYGYVLKYYGKYDYGVQKDNLYSKLKKLGLNKRSEHKFIPEPYLWDTLENRYQLIQGLIDTDGYVDNRGHMSYTSVSEVLAKNVQTLAWSLGAKATITSKDTGYQRAYTVYINARNLSQFVCLPRKQKLLKKYNGGIGKLDRRIVSVKKLKQKIDTRCIVVSNPNRLYITDGFVVTHNTDAGQAWFLYDYENPQFRGLVVRRNADDLRDWTDRARTFYKGKAEVLGQPPEVRFHSQAIVRTGHLKDANAYTKYQGHEYHRQLIEELTHIPREEDYLKLIASCRSTVPGLKPQVMANCNPDGPGFQWVKKRWNIEGTPTEPIWTTDPQTGLKRVFIPSRVQDNPTLMTNDPSYIESLKGLPAGLREAWLLGSWADPIIPGAYYTEALRELRQKGRVGDVPYDPTMKVWTVWDLGIGGQLVCLFVQRTSTAIHVIDAWQGENSDGIPQAKKMLDDKNYVYGGHFAPHDSSRTETGTGKTVYDTALALGLEFLPIPHLKVRDGITKALMMIPRLQVDETRCEQALEAWKHYRRVWDEKKLDWKDEPFKDWTNHFADTLRYLALSEDMMTGEYSNVTVTYHDE